MFAQFFGSYLLNHDAVSPNDLTAAISLLADTHIKLGTLAMHMGYMRSVFFRHGRISALGRLRWSATTCSTSSSMSC